MASHAKTSLLVGLGLGAWLAAGCSDTSFTSTSRQGGKGDADAQAAADPADPAADPAATPDGAGDAADAGPGDAADSGQDGDDGLPGDTDQGGDKHPKSDAGVGPLGKAAVLDGSADAAAEDGAGNRRETFGFGGDVQTRVADFLFIIDNSCSMETLQTKVTAGFQSLIADKAAFPANSRVAVMTTQVGDPDDLSRLNHDINDAPGQDEDPGFLRLVTGATIAAYKKVASSGTAKNFPLAGCDAPWFGPQDKHPSGHSCFSAAIQTGRECVGSEAGLTALGQMLQKQGKKALFRGGAAVNVIYVSDTHDPGSISTVLLESRPDYAALRAAVLKANQVASFKIHAIAPNRKCSKDEDVHDKAYYKAADISGGAKLDSCSAADYVPFLKSMIEKGTAVTLPTFRLGKPAKAILGVTVDGAATTAYKLSADGQVLTLTKEFAATKHAVVVTYEVK
jgi:hypothetical protein